MQAGTLSGNPLAMAAGVATLSLLDSSAYEALDHSGARLERGLTEAIRASGIDGCVQRAGSLLTLFFSSGPIRDDVDAARADRGSFAGFPSRHAFTRRHAATLPVWSARSCPSRTTMASSTWWSAPPHDSLKEIVG